MPSTVASAARYERRRLAQQHRRQLARLVPEEVQHPCLAPEDMDFDLSLPPSGSFTTFADATLIVTRTLFAQHIRGAGPAEEKMLLRFGRELRTAYLEQAKPLIPA